MVYLGNRVDDAVTIGVERLRTLGDSYQDDTPIRVIRT